MEANNHMPYRLKHKPTGLYFKPLDGGSSNLSKRGKIYYNDYAYNQLMKTDNHFQGFGYLEIFAYKSAHKKETDYLFELGQRIHNGEFPELKLGYDHTDKHCVHMSIINNPDHWEKEYLNIIVEPINKQDE